MLHLAIWQGLHSLICTWTESTVLALDLSLKSDFETEIDLTGIKPPYIINLKILRLQRKYFTSKLDNFLLSASKVFIFGANFQYNSNFSCFSLFSSQRLSAK